MKLEEVNIKTGLDFGEPLGQASRSQGLEKVVNKKGKKRDGIWSRMFRKKRLKNPKYVAVLLLRNNGIAEPMEIESKNGFLNIYGKTYHENADCIFSLSKDKIPLAIIPEWSMIPIGKKKWEDKEMLEKFAELQDHLLRGIRYAELVRMGEDKQGMKISPKAVIGLILLLIVGGIIVSQYL